MLTVAPTSPHLREVFLAVSPHHATAITSQMASYQFCSVLSQQEVENGLNVRAGDLRWR